MVVIAASPAEVPGLPPYDPDQSLSVGAACRLGLVPGHDGRRATAAEVRKWSRVGFPVGPVGPRYRFPAARVRGTWRTTVPWCCAWVRFIAAVRAGDVMPRGHRPAAEVA